MQSLWNDEEAAQFGADVLSQRVYTSRLLGRDPSLVLHGGGNTSVKDQATNLFGDREEVIYIKGSGWDLETIEPAGFAAVKLDVLLRMAELEVLADVEMVKGQRAAMIDPSAPNPSVEAILHGLIPFKFVDHTHADAILAITNTADGEKRIRQLLGDDILVVPYVMPGFKLAQKVYQLSREVDWQTLECMILLNHGIFTFADSARDSYEQMIAVVNRAEEYVHAEAGRAPEIATAGGGPEVDLRALARLRSATSRTRGCPVLADLRQHPKTLEFVQRADLQEIASRGPQTPDHASRSKGTPVVVNGDVEECVEQFAEEYMAYFQRQSSGGLTALDPAPRWALWPSQGLVSLGRTLKEIRVIRDIAAHTMQTIEWAEGLGGWRALPESSVFDVEYWDLQQAKSKLQPAPLPLQGRVALVTGAASGIGRACAETLCEQGAVVSALDIRTEITTCFEREDVFGQVCDVTRDDQLEQCVAATVRRFGGLDILVCNAGLFPPSQRIADLTAENWERSLSVNLSSHRVLLTASVPYLELGLDPAVVIIASKNVPAPGPGAAAYSVAKAGLTQLARVAALELADQGIRVNILHPNAVFDTALWTDELLESRAAHYGMTVEEYKTNNLLHREVTSRDVAALACAMAGPLFAKTTGAQVPIDGGNERVI
jgi:rhamnose utilization protein RhaD (predicted bifunctional aldolase and dehydrogenase)/NAD(P)-dependent dehydrogenase (short-subunit alcohol dehydrogenase family)